MRETIAIDIDEVLAPLHELFFAYHNEVYGTNYPVMGEHYHIDEYTGESNESLIRKLRHFLETDSYKQLRPFEDAAGAMERLSHDYDLVVLTSRQDIFVESTERWLQKYFPKVFKAVHFSHYVVGTGVSKPKAEFCQEIGAAYLVDDSLSTILKCPEHDIKGLLFGNYPWNAADSLPDGCVRVSDWQAVTEFFDAQRS
jgi:5'(3')-deoxyribonucleotidase